jgi:replicative DNA helicase
MKKVPIKSKTEQAALSMIVHDNDILKNQKWDASYFAIEAHRLVFEAIEGFYTKAGVCDIFQAITELESRKTIETVGGDQTVFDLLNTMNIPAGKVSQDIANDYRVELAEAKAYRDVIATYEEMEKDIRAGVADLSKLSKTIDSSSDINAVPRRTKKDIINKIIDEMEGKVKEDVFPTGLIMLDKHMKGGMHRGEMMTVAAETGGGKSILLVQSALANLEENKPVLFLSLEMSSDDVYRRMAAHLAGVPIREAEDYKTEHRFELPKLGEAFAKLSKLPITVIDGISHINDIEAEITRHASEGKAEVVCCDYIQIISADGDSREGTISEIARRLKVMALRHNFVIFTASQLNDEGKLRESRAIGMHSDQVVMVEHIKEKTRIIVKKNRRGIRNATVSVVMNGELSKFEPVYL